MGTNRAIRGYNSARNWNYNNADNRNDNIGWRPALLEPKEAACLRICCQDLDSQGSLNPSPIETDGVNT